MEVEYKNLINHPVQKELPKVNVFTNPYPFFLTRLDFSQSPHVTTGRPKSYRGYISFYNPISRLLQTLNKNMQVKIIRLLISFALLVNIYAEVEANYSHNASPSLLVKRYDCQEGKNLQRNSLVAVDEFKTPHHTQNSKMV